MSELNDEKIITGTDLLHEFAELSKRKKILEKEKKETEAELAKLEQAVIDHMVENDINNIKIAKMTLYLAEISYGNLKVSKDEFMEKIKNSKYGYIVKENYNTNQLNALLREVTEGVETQLKEEGIHPTTAEVNKHFPKELRDIIEIATSTKVRARSA